MRPVEDKPPEGASSAVPADLRAYSEAAVQIDEHIHQLALRLGRVLDAYRATKPEFGRPIPRIEDDLERYARRCLDIDLRVGLIADAFEHAGSAPQGGSGGATSSQPVVAAETTIAAALEQAQHAKAAPPRPKKKEEHHGGGLLGGLVHAVEHPVETLSGAVSAVEHTASDAWGTVEHAAEHRLHDVEDAGAALVHGIEHPAETLDAVASGLEKAAGEVADLGGHAVSGATSAGGEVLHAVEHPGDTAAALGTDAEHVAGAALQGLEATGGGILHAIEHPLERLSSAEQAAEDFVTGFAAGVRDMAQAAMLLARVIPGTPTWMASMAIDPEGTVTLQEKFAKGLALMVEHPVDVLGNMIDIKDLQSGDYAKWLGHLTPDVIVTVLTMGGGGEAAAAGEGVAKAAGETAAATLAPPASDTTATLGAEAMAAAEVRRLAQDAARGVLTTPKVSSPRLQNIINNLYKGTMNPQRIGSGTTMDAIRNELEVGGPTNGTWHLVKGAESARGLTNWLARNPGAPFQDRLVAQSVLDELTSAFHSGGGFPR